MDEKVKAWWDTLGDQQRIVCALLAYTAQAGLTVEQAGDVVYCAEKPWKWAPEAYAMTHPEPGDDIDPEHEAFMADDPGQYRQRGLV